MKWKLILGTVLILMVYSCVTEQDDVMVSRESGYVPVLMDADALEGSIAYQPGRDLNNPGKIYLYHNYLFISEKYKGVHIIDNSDPEHPQNIGFVKVPGCIDIAVKGTNLYADNATDLVAIDVEHFPDIKVTKRLEDVLPEPSPPDGLDVPYEFRKDNRPENTVIIEWKKNPENN